MGDKADEFTSIMERIDCQLSTVSTFRTDLAQRVLNVEERSQNSEHFRGDRPAST